jgi:hypothetical protein
MKHGWSVFALGGMCLWLAAGCATPVANLGIGERDRKVCESAEAVPFRIAVVWQDAGGDAQAQKLAESVRNGMLAELAKSRNVEPVFTPESPGRRLFSGPAKPPDLAALGVGYGLTFSVKQAAMRSLGTGSDGTARYKGTLTLEVTLEQVATQTAVLSRRIAVESTSVTPHADPKDALPVLLEAGDAAAAQAVRDVLAECVPTAVVRQTKGDGQVALLNIGADDTIQKGAKIEFILFRDKGGERLAIPFATGKVVEVEAKTCWVKVDKYEDAGVMENHFARLSKNQTQSFIEKMEGKMGM